MFLGLNTYTQNYNDKQASAAINCSFECQSSSLQKSCTGISTVEDCISWSLLLRCLICHFFPFLPPFPFLVYFCFSLLCFPFVLLLQGHDDAAPCAVLKSVDSFSFLQHPVHQRSLEILQRCKEEKYSKAANTTINNYFTLWLGETVGARLTNINYFTTLHCSQNQAIRVKSVSKLRDIMLRFFFLFLIWFTALIFSH